MFHEAMEARVRTGYADIESRSRGQTRVGQEATAKRELQVLDHIIRADPPVTRGQQESLLTSSQSDDSQEPPSLFTTDGGDRPLLGSVQRRSTG